MTTETKQVGSSGKVQMPGGMARAGYFTLHFLEMCVVMCIAGVGILSGLLRWAGPLMGYPDLKAQFPGLTTVVLALWLTLTMIAWMRFRGHEWRPTLEMASTSMVALPPLISAAWLGAIPKTSLYALECPLACFFMLVPMLLRLDHYSGAHSNHAHMDHAEHHAHV